MHTCQITPQIVKLTTGIAERIGQLEGVKLHKPNPMLRRRNRIHAIQSSLSIEGNSLTREQVTAIVDAKPVTGSKADILEVQNAIRTYEHLSKFDPLCIASFLNAHAMLMAGLIPSSGLFRTGPIGVMRFGDIFHEFLPWEQIEPTLQMLFTYLKTSDDHLLLKSCRFHFQVENIHPFVDGNGRMGRLWQTRLLMIYHPIFEYLPVEDFIKGRQDDYYLELASGDDTGDCTGFVILMLELILDSLNELIAETQSVLLTATDRLSLAMDSFGANSFTRKEYQAVFKTISTATASRDLQKGVELGLLIRSGDKRTAVYQVAPTTTRRTID
jgi:Fic family protein